MSCSGRRRATFVAACGVFVAFCVDGRSAHALSDFDKSPLATVDVFKPADNVPVESDRRYVVGHSASLLDGSDDLAGLLAYTGKKLGSTPFIQPTFTPMAVDGLNVKIDGYGGGADHANGLFGTEGSVALPLGQLYGVQVDGGVGNFNGAATSNVGGHLFWRNPSVGLAGGFISYSHLSAPGSPTFARYAGEGELYWNRWTFGGLAGLETVSVDSAAVGGLTIPNRFFDAIAASYYVNNDFKLSIGHVYTLGRNALTFGGEYGLRLGGGRMASLYVNGYLGEGGTNSVLAGIRLYFGQHDKTLMDRNRQDDPLTVNNYGLETNSDGFYFTDDVNKRAADFANHQPFHSKNCTDGEFVSDGCICPGPPKAEVLGGQCSFLGPSDARLKRDIVEVGRLPNGIGLYRFRYLWSDEVYVGVIAQEVAAVLPTAVRTGPGGYLQVHYAPIGIVLQTWEQWLAAGERPEPVPGRNASPALYGWDSVKTWLSDEPHGSIPHIQIVHTRQVNPA